MMTMIFEVSGLRPLTSRVAYSRARLCERHRPDAFRHAADCRRADTGLTWAAAAAGVHDVRIRARATPSQPLHE